MTFSKSLLGGQPRHKIRLRQGGSSRMAMAGNIKVTPEQLQSIAGQLNGGASNIEQINSQLQSQVAPLPRALG